MSSRNNHESDELSDRVLEVGARLDSGPSGLLVHAAFNKELEDQKGLFEAMGLADLAHTLVMMEGGIVPSEAGRELLAALLQLHEHPADFTPDPARGDLYTNREAWLAEHSHASGWLGAGRARREATTTAFLIKVREGLLGLAGALIATGQAITARAEESRFALMPDYTYLQAAQPTSFGHYLLGFVYPMLRDLDRIRELYRRVNRSPAGCGSTNGSRLPQDRERLSELLGFDGLVTHARDAMWQADLPIETVALLTTILINLDRLAEDLQIFSTEEFALVELSDQHARASKIMPQKKNPYALTHVRGLASTMIGTLAASAAAGRTPSGQPDNRLPLYGLIPRAIADTRAVVELMGEVLSLLTFNDRHARRKLNTGFALATDLAETLVLDKFAGSEFGGESLRRVPAMDGGRHSGLDFRQAHRLVGHLVRSHLPDGDFDGLTPDELATAAERVLGVRMELPSAVLRDALDPEAAVSARTGTGGAAPEAMDVMIAQCDQALAEAEVWTSDCRRRLRTAEESLFRTAQEYLRAR